MLSGEEESDRGLEVVTIDDRGVDHVLVGIERTHRELPFGELCRQLVKVLRRDAWVSVQEDRTCRSVRGVGSERVVGDEE
jgi:hypothetical protein